MTAAFSVYITFFPIEKVKTLFKQQMYIERVWERLTERLSEN